MLGEKDDQKLHKIGPSELDETQNFFFYQSIGPRYRDDGLFADRALGAA
jgi:hypothetical protein